MLELIFRIYKSITKKPDCYIWFGEYDHDYQWTPNEPDVGLYAACECQSCGHINEEADYNNELSEIGDRE